MGINDVMHIARTGLNAAKSNITTTGHNISNANTEGFSRQRIKQEAVTPRSTSIKGDFIGRGVKTLVPDRINDEYLEKQMRSGARDLAHFEEKGMALQQVEDIFNEMDGDGLNRLMTRLFNEFRKLSNDPNSQAARESVREASQSVVNDFKRVRKELASTVNHIDNRIENYVKEVNQLGREICDINKRIQVVEVTRGAVADLYDQRDILLKKLAQNVDVTVSKDENNLANVAIKGVGPLVSGTLFEQLTTERTTTPGDPQKIDNTVDVYTDYKPYPLTGKITGAKLGALLNVRDQTISNTLNKLDELAFRLTDSINQIHRQGFSRNGASGVDFFKPLDGKHRAAEFLDLSDEVKRSSDFIAAAAQQDSPGDNRIAIALSGLQNLRLMGDGKSTMDDFFNGIVGDVGVLKSSNTEAVNQQRGIVTQLSKMRDQISGVSLDEETANLLQFQHSFDASAKVIQVADKMLESVMEIMK